MSPSALAQMTRALESIPGMGIRQPPPAIAGGIFPLTTVHLVQNILGHLVLNIKVL